MGGLRQSWNCLNVLVKMVVVMGKAPKRTPCQVVLELKWLRRNLGRAQREVGPIGLWATLEAW